MAARGVMRLLNRAKMSLSCGAASTVLSLPPPPSATEALRAAVRLPLAWDDQEFSDIEVVGEGGLSYRAHRVLLAHCGSPFFARLAQSSRKGEATDDAGSRRRHGPPSRSGR